MPLIDTFIVFYYFQFFIYSSFIFYHFLKTMIYFFKTISLHTVHTVRVGLNAYHQGLESSIWRCKKARSVGVFIEGKGWFFTSLDIHLGFYQTLLDLNCSQCQWHQSRKDRIDYYWKTMKNQGDFACLQWIVWDYKSGISESASERWWKSSPLSRSNSEIVFSDCNILNPSNISADFSW